MTYNTHSPVRTLQPTSWGCRCSGAIIAAAACYHKRYCTYAILMVSSRSVAAAAVAAVAVRCWPKPGQGAWQGGGTGECQQQRQRFPLPLPIALWNAAAAPAPLFVSQCIAGGNCPFTIVQATVAAAVTKQEHRAMYTPGTEGWPPSIPTARALIDT